VELDPDREVAVLPGTKTGIMLCALAAAGEGEGVLLPDHGYPDYLSAIGLTGARHLACRSTRRPDGSPTSTPHRATPPSPS
jgi:aminotransferase